MNPFAMTTSLQISTNFSPLNLSTLHGDTYKKPITFRATKFGSLHQNKFKLRVYKEKWSFFGEERWEDGIFLTAELRKRQKREVLVRFSEGFGFNGGGGGGRDDGATARLLGNLALAIGLTYLSMTGQLGWLLDAIVSIWVLSLCLKIV